MKKKIWQISVLTILLFALSCCLLGCGKESQQEAKYEIKFADVGWDSVKFHNAVAGFIAESAYGYTWKEIPGSTPIMHEAMVKGEIDVNMEEWTDNIATYPEDLAAGLFQDLGTNFNDNIQGFYVPRYVVEGDPERGIAPMAPDLHSVQDLRNYADLFPDDENPGKGRIYGAIPGWEVNEIMRKKVTYNGLDSQYNYFQPGSDSALSAAFTSAYEKGQPIVGYYWEPIWLTGKYDLVLLQDYPYTDTASYKEGKTACPSVNVTIVVSNQFYDENADFCAFLKNYETSSALVSEALAYMQDTKANYKEAAQWFLTEHPELIDQWLPEEKATLVKSSLGSGSATINYFWDFPYQLPIDVEAFDSSVNAFAKQFSGFFGKIRDGLNLLINGINFILSYIPWWLMILMVGFAGWKVSKKITTGLLYMVLLAFIGFIGLWNLMYEHYLLYWLPL